MTHFCLLRKVLIRKINIRSNMVIIMNDNAHGLLIIVTTYDSLQSACSDVHRFNNNVR